VILRQEEHAKSECLAVSKTAVYQAVIKFKNCSIQREASNEASIAY